ncbi:MAG: xylulokinase, partial [Armatimonadetes bacterium]|nr:xylulokinase [Armatimonadota bacterium]
LGVALLAGVGTGVWPAVEAACDAIIKPVEVTEPRAAQAAVYQDIYSELYASLYGNLRAQFARGAAIVARLAP